MLHIDHLKKSYGSFQLDVSLDIEAGQIVGLVGANGSGKTTTFKSILQLIHIDGGDIRILGEELNTPEKQAVERRQRIGAVLADSGFSGYITAGDAGAILAAMYRNFEKDRFESLCRQLSVPTDKLIKEFSTGMKAKLKIAAALSHQADLLILDEPTAGLDVITRDELLDLLRSYMEEKEERAILISSHISSDLEGLCDNIYMIHEGKIVLHEDTDVLLSDYAVLKVSLADYEKLDKQYLLRVKREGYGYTCLTSQKRYYLENYPGAVIENGSIDDVILMLARGEEVQ